MSAAVAKPLVPGFSLVGTTAAVPGFGPPSASLLAMTTAKPGIAPPPSSSPSGSSQSGRSGPPPGSPPPSKEDAAKYAQYAKGLLQQYDKNKNGVLEQEEWSEMKKSSKTLLGDVKENDTNRDGKISIEELIPALMRYSRSRSGSSSGGFPGRGSDLQKQFAYRFRTALERLPSGMPSEFLQKDTDGDGQVAMAEFLAGQQSEARAAEFAQYDLNGDGFITAEEWLGVVKQKEKDKKGQRGRGQTTATETASRTTVLNLPPMEPRPPVRETPPAAVSIPERSRLDTAPPPPGGPGFPPPGGPGFPPPRGPEMMRSGERPTPESRFDEMERAVGHGSPMGVLTKEEFIRGLKQSGSKLADRAGETFDRMTKADPNRITKAEYVKFFEGLFSSGGKKGKKRG